MGRAAAEDAPSLEAAFRAAPLVDDARVVPDAAAVGVVLSAGAARVVVGDDRGVVGVAGSCRCDLRTRTAPGADLARATRTVRLEVVAGAPLVEDGEAFPQPGFARLTVVAARRPRPAPRRDALRLPRGPRRAARPRVDARARLGLAAAAGAGPGRRAGRRPAAAGPPGRARAHAAAPGGVGRRPRPGRAGLRAALAGRGPRARADALERGVDAVLHGIEDVEASYEHELIAVRDDLRRTLAELIAARTSAARRLAALEARATAAATSDLDRRVAALRGPRRARHGRQVPRAGSSSRAPRGARPASSLARRWRLWRPAFLSFVVVFAVWAAKMRGFWAVDGRTRAAEGSHQWRGVATALPAGRR